MRFVVFLVGIIWCWGTQAQEILYTIPSEESEHEATWLQWPHNHTYGWGASDFVPAFIEMTQALVSSERVHIVAYNNQHENQIINQLNNNGIPMDSIDIYVHNNDDFWVRDNGPVFVYNADGVLHITDWGFNGWGGDTPYELCDEIPNLLAADLEIPVIDLNHVVLEGGAIEIDGNGSMLATRSSITGDDRNPDLTEEEIEEYMTTYLGITNFIWLDGVYGGNLDITDQHIDAIARFHGDDMIITMSEDDLATWEVQESDIEAIYSATNVDGEPYMYSGLPITVNDVVTEWGEDMQFKGSYVNFYVANSVVLVPQYEDPNDPLALAFIQNLYPDKEAIGIDCRNLFGVGGMVHCVTQQQPISNHHSAINSLEGESQKKLIKIFDLHGREVFDPHKLGVYIYFYDDNSIVKKLITTN
jgi:agmatine deiminase